jgi:hypothetical protein
VRSPFLLFGRCLPTTLHLPIVVSGDFGFRCFVDSSSNALVMNLTQRLNVVKIGRNVAYGSFAAEPFRPWAGACRLLVQ